jgi:acetyl/propionyl-CoA carboxylase alpha subunit
VRIDSGVVEGGTVPVHYDPLLAKVIARGEDRGQALARLIEALRDFPILGVRTNVAFLLRVLAGPRFRAGMVDTAFVDDNLDALTASTPDLPAHVAAAVAAHSAQGRGARSDAASVQAGAAVDPWNDTTGWRTR